MSLKFRLSSIVLALCEIVIGVLILLNPVRFTTGIIICVGIVLLIVGVVSIVRYFRADAETAAHEQNLTRGLIALVVGVFCAFNSDWFILTFPLLTVVYGIMTLFSGIGKIQWTADMIRLKTKKWFWAAISAVLTIAFAVVILIDPFTSSAALWMFVGIALLVEAVIDLIAAIFTKSEEEKEP